MLLGEEVKSKECWSLNILLSAELLGRSEGRSTSEMSGGSGGWGRTWAYCNEIFWRLEQMLEEGLEMRSSR